MNSTNTANYDVVVTSQSGSATSGAGTLTVIHPVSTQNDGVPDNWKPAHGIDPNSAAAINGHLGDIDEDGHSNFLEYAFNTDPQVKESDIVQSATNSGYFEITFPMRVAVVDLLYSVEVSEDLLTWSDAAGNYQVLSITPDLGGITDTVTVRILPAMTNAAKKFVRIKVTAQ